MDTKIALMTQDPAHDVQIELREDQIVLGIVHAEHPTSSRYVTLDAEESRLVADALRLVAGMLSASPEDG